MLHAIAIVGIIILAVILTALAVLFAVGFVAEPTPGEEGSRKAGLAALGVLIFATAVALSVSIYGVRS